MPKTTKKKKGPTKKKKGPSKKKSKSKQKKGPCWTGYHKKKGMADYSDGSCVKN